MKTRRIHPRASIVASVILAGGATVSSLAWSGCSSPEQSGSQGSALGQDDATSSVVISQVYGAGNNSGATLNADFVELFNRGSAVVTLNGWSIQYTSTKGSPSTDITALKTVTLQPGEYYLVGNAAPTTGTINGVNLPATDDTLLANLSGSAGTVFLTNAQTALACVSGTKCTDASIVDQVGYGAGDTNFSGAGPSGTNLSATTSLIRKGAKTTDDGCFDPTGEDNSTDFEIITVTATSPRNSKTAANVCAGGTTGGTGNGAGLLISQVYGGGGNSKATYDTDFVELFNPTAAAISTKNLSIQYGSAAGDIAVPFDGGPNTNLVPLPTASIPAGGYYLVAMGTPAVTNPVGAAFTSDFVGTAALGASSGKVALVNNTTALMCGSPTTQCAPGSFLDLVAYGGVNGMGAPVPSQYEGTGPAPALSSVLSAQRGGSGCTNAKDNSTDFTAATPIIRNSTTAVNECGGGMTDAGTDSGTDSGTGTGTDAGGDSGTGPVDSGTKDSGGGGTEDAGDSGGGGGGGGDGSTGLVISQVFGDGAYAATQPDADYVEIFNRGSSALSLKGLSLQYASATSDFAVPYDGGDTNLIVLPDVSVPAGGYFLVALAGGDAGTPLPTPDFTGQANLSYDNGKIALVNGTTALSTCGSSGALCPTSDFVDLVGYGTASQFEGAPTTTVNGSGAGIRNDEGCTDTDNNAADFTAGTPAPHNMASPLHLCSGGGGGGGGGGADSGTGGGGGGGGGGSSTADSGTSSGDDDDDGDDDGSGTTGGGKGVTMVVSDPNSGGCSTSGNANEGALGFGAFAIAALAFANRRKRNAA